MRTSHCAGKQAWLRGRLFGLLIARVLVQFLLAYGQEWPTPPRLDLHCIVELAPQYQDVAGQEREGVCHLGEGRKLQLLSRAFRPRSYARMRANI